MPTSKSVQSYSKEPTFFELVYEVVRMIPEGRVTSYGAIGEYLGAAKSARMVGWAMNAAHNLIPAVPAHRLVNRVGCLTGKAHFHPPEKMEALLVLEGIEVKNDQIVNFNQVFWNPMEELKIE